MLTRIYNYSYRYGSHHGERTQSIYQKYVDQFLDSDELKMDWQCEDERELDNTQRGFRRALQRKGLSDAVRIRMSYKDLVIGLEYYEDESFE